MLKSWGYNPEPSITNKNKDKIIRMFNDGWSYQYIADEIGCDIAAIYRAIKKWGLSRKK